MLDTETKGRAVAPSNCESSENYGGVIYAKDIWRVIACKDDRQWIIQRAENKPHGRAWRGVSYHKGRKSLIRVWHAKTGDYHGAVNLSKILPTRFKGGKHA